jgi:hypothetical protein
VIASASIALDKIAVFFSHLFMRSSHRLRRNDASAVRAGLYSSLTYLTLVMVERNVVQGEQMATVGLDQAGLESFIDSDN